MDTASDSAPQGDMYDGDTLVGSDNDTLVGSDNGSFTSVINVPRADAPRSYWQDDAPFSHLEERSLAGTGDKVDVVIIGSGITGVGVAKSLLELTASQGKAPVVVVAEARDICGGATGRNGGIISLESHVLRSTYNEYSGLTEPASMDMLEFHRNGLQAIKELAGAYESVDMNMGVREVEMVEIFHDSERELGQFNRSKNSADFLRRQHPQYQVTVLEKNEVSELDANLSACGAVTYKAGSLKPYHLVRSIWNDLVDKYPNLYIGANNVVGGDIRFSASSSHPYYVPCSDKTLQARHVVHASGGHASRHLPALNKSLTCYSMLVFVQRRGPAFPKCDKERTWRLYVDGQVFDVIQLPDKDGENGNLMVVSRNVDVGEWDDGIQPNEALLTHLQRCMARIFGPGCGEGEVLLKSWSGIVGMSGDALPFVGRIPPEYTNREAWGIGDPSLYEAAEHAEDGDDTGLVAPGEWISAGHGLAGMTSALLCGQALGIQIAGMEDEVFEKVAGRPGGKLNDWFPGKELSLDDDRLRIADWSRET